MIRPPPALVLQLMVFQHVESHQTHLLKLPLEPRHLIYMNILIHPSPQRPPFLYPSPDLPPNLHMKREICGGGMLRLTQAHDSRSMPEHNNIATLPCRDCRRIMPLIKAPGDLYSLLIFGRLSQFSIDRRLDAPLSGFKRDRVSRVYLLRPRSTRPTTDQIPGSTRYPTQITVTPWPGYFQQRRDP